MRKILLYFITLTVIFHSTKSAQPHFPDQIVFTIGDGTSLYAIDQINQQAYFKAPFNIEWKTEGFFMKNFSYAPPDTPQSKYYVYLSQILEGFSCSYHTFSKHGINQSSTFFPSHWCDGIVCHIGDFVTYNYTMIHSKLSMLEDHWYSNETCQIDDKQTYPCQEIYFIKDTDIPLRYFHVAYYSNTSIVREKTSFLVLSTGKPIDKYFETIPKQWPGKCKDDELNLLAEPNSLDIKLNESATIEVWLSSSPHTVDGSDKVIVHWNATDCNDCFQVRPYEVSFNSQNFDQKQTFTVTRLKNSQSTTLKATVNGGGFDADPGYTYEIHIQ